MDERLLQLIIDKLSGLEGKIDNLSSRVAKMESAIELAGEVRHDVDALKGRIAVLETRVNLYAAIAGSVGAVIGTGIGGLAVHFLGK